MRNPWEDTMSARVHRWRRWVTVVTAVLASSLLPGMIAGSQTASAVVNLKVICDGVGTLSFNPGVTTLESRQIAVAGTATVGPCVDINGQPTPVVSAFVEGTGELTGSCVSGAGQGFATVTWLLEDGGTDFSIVRIEGSYTAGAGLSAAGNAVVVDGRYPGANFAGLGIIFPVGPVFGCLTPTGITLVAGFGVGIAFTITLP
jgi:hypothetical protein